MKIQLNADAYIDGTEALVAEVSAPVEQALERFSEHLPGGRPSKRRKRGKNGQRDQCYMLEARLERRQPMAATEQAATLTQAVYCAAQKLARLLDSTLGRLHEHRDKAPDPGMPGTEEPVQR